jgi:hypothetical protein
MANTEKKQKFVFYAKTACSKEKNVDRLARSETTNQQSPSSRTPLFSLYTTLLNKTYLSSDSLQLLTGGFFGFLCLYFIQHCFSDPTLSEDAGIEPKTVAATAMAVGRSNHSATVDLIHSRLDLIHTRLDLIHTRLDFIHG